MSRFSPETRIPLSFAQQRLWFLHQLEGTSGEYHVPEGFLLRGALDRDALRRALDALVARHESLRTRFPTLDGEPLQLVEPELRLELPVEEVDGVPESRLSEALWEEWERPFDLAAGPLVRARLLRFGARSHGLVLTTHHLVSDGWSQALLRHELQALYAAYRAGREPALPPIPLRYADFALAQRRRGDFEGDLAYWKERLAGLPERLELPADRPRRSAVASPASVLRLVVGGEALVRLREVSRASRATLYMTMLAAFAVLLARSSGRDDVAVGSPIAGRQKAELERLVGLFLNTLVLRIGVRREATFAELLEEVRQTALEAYRHQDAPFERVVEEVSPARRLDATPLFQVVFSVLAAPAQPLRLEGLEVEQVRLRRLKSTLDLEVHAFERPEELELFWAYDETLFERERMERMARRYVRLLEQAVADPARAVGDYELVDDDERAWLAERSRGPRREVPEGNVYELFAAQAARSPDAVAVRFEGVELTYAELEARAAAIAVPPEALVGVRMERGPALVAALLGILRAGAVYVPLDPSDPRPEPLAEVDLMLTDPGDAKAVAPPRPVSGHDAAYVIHTSGSTGVPKGVVATHGALASQLRWLAEEFRLGPDDRVLQKASIGFDASIAELLAPLVTGGRLVVARPGGARDPDYLVDLIAREGITFLDLPPSLLRVLLAHPGFARCTSLRWVLSGGDVLPLELRDEFRRVVPAAALYNTYGPTETTVQCTFHDCSRGGGYRSVPIGRPIANTEVHVLDERMRPVPVGVVGELYVGGAGLARGYLNRPELTAERFVPDPSGGGGRLYRTGDLVRFGFDGELEFFGRTDDQVKLRGYRIELGEIEAVLRRHPAVEQAVAALRGERLVAYVVGTAAPEELRAHLRRQLPEHMVPAVLAPLDALPLTSSGKVDRAALPAPRVEAKAGRGPRTPQEEALCRAFAEVLGLERVGIDDSFFTLGGHSLLTMRLVERIHDDLGVRLGVRTLFEAPTVAELAGRLGARPPEDGALERVLPLRRTGSLPPLVCLPPATGLGWSYAGLVAGLDPERPVYALQAAWNGTLPESIEALADDYASFVRGIQPDGPCLLAGWSFGALLAHAVACRLRDVALLALLDGYPLADLPRAPEQPDPVRELAELLRLSVDGEVGDVASLVEAARRAAHPLALLSVEQAERIVHLFAHHGALARGHRPARFNGAVTFVAAAERPDVLSPALWRPYVSGAIDVHELPCTHLELTDPGPVAVIGSLLEAAA
jgi:amino acid adenylation domain-containing protein